MFVCVCARVSSKWEMNSIKFRYWFGLLKNAMIYFWFNKCAFWYFLLVFHRKSTDLLVTDALKGNQIDFQSAIIDLYLEKIISWDEPSSQSVPMCIYIWKYVAWTALTFTMVFPSNTLQIDNYDDVWCIKQKCDNFQWNRVKLLDSSIQNRYCFFSSFYRFMAIIHDHMFPCHKPQIKATSDLNITKTGKKTG